MNQQVKQAVKERPFTVEQARAMRHAHRAKIGLEAELPKAIDSIRTRAGNGESWFLFELLPESDCLSELQAELESRGFSANVHPDAHKRVLRIAW